MMDLIRAPWTSEQVAALNRFQTEGGMHPFTCAYEHPAHPKPVLRAAKIGWRCNVIGCDYEQDWAHAFMADPSRWPRPFAELRAAAVPACIHPEGYDGECPCPPNCGCCKVTATAPDPDQFRADAEAWRHKAVRRALTISRLRGTIDACIDLVDEAVTDRSPRGDGYRAAISDLREVLQEFGHLDSGSGTAPEPAHDAGGPDVADCAAVDRNWDAQKAGE
ncbi:hypothetical protein ABT119_06185 [Streptomyces sp. NPDC001910]|uniref:hypothetical protein n=1 Tax=Streptomyces sp. NPDC001910 TaxID=3154403 RepID=UPI00331892A2